MSEYLFKTDKEIMTCQECPIVKRHGLGTTCPLREGAERKYGTCPLEEVQTHGDLIDRQKLLEIATAPYGNFYGFESLIRDIKNAPTIIEASEETE